jgi:hypothetical protein
MASTYTPGGVEGQGISKLLETLKGRRHFRVSSEWAVIVPEHKQLRPAVFLCLVFMSLSTWSVDLEVIPKKSTRNKEKPHLARQFAVVLPAIVEHPIRGSTHDEEIGENNSASNRIFLKVSSIASDHPDRGCTHTDKYYRPPSRMPRSRSYCARVTHKR